MKSPFKSSRPSAAHAKRLKNYLTYKSANIFKIHSRTENFHNSLESKLRLKLALVTKPFSYSKFETQPTLGQEVLNVEFILEVIWFAGSILALSFLSE